MNSIAFSKYSVRARQVIGRALGVLMIGFLVTVLGSETLLAQALEEVIVTAQKREQSLQDVAIAVTALSGDELSKANVTTPGDLNKLIPSLNVTDAGGGNTQIYVRGVGTFSSNSYADNAVAFSYDGVYLDRPAGPRGTFYDVQRVELLKGPQGTLYGRNATGGAINVIPTAPQLGGDAVSGYFGFTAGNYSRISGTGAVNIPTGDTSAVRLAGTFNQADGYFTDGYGDMDDYAVRAQFLTEPNDKLRVKLNADYYTDTSMGSASGSSIRPYLEPGEPWLGGADQESVDFALAFNGCPPAPPFICANPLPPAKDGFMDLVNWGVHAIVDYDFGFSTLTVIPAYRQVNNNSLHYKPGFRVFNDETSDQFTLEARLASDAGQSSEKVEWVVGLYYFDSNIDNHGDFSQGFNATEIYYGLDNSNYAFFGEAGLHVSDRVTLRAGLRYTNEDKKQNTDSANYIVNGETIDPRIFTNIVGDATFDSTTWKLGLEYQVGEDALLYTSVSTGFKAGGFFAADPGDNTYDPEKITAYTVGMKSLLLDGRLQLNGEIYYWDYTDQQHSFLSSTILGGELANVFVTRNIGKATLKGIELETKYAVSDAGLLGLNLLFQDSSYDEFIYPSGLPLPPGSRCTSSPPFPFIVDCSGQDALSTPRWSGSLSYTHTFELSGGATLEAGLQTRFESKSEKIITYQADIAVQGSFTTTDLYLDWYSADKKWSIGAFVNNVEDQDILTGGFNRPGTSILYGFLEAPRTYGGRVQVNF